jgi:hypothetical protein
MAMVLGRGGAVGGGQVEGHGARGKVGPWHTRANGTGGGGAAVEAYARSDGAPGGARTRASRVQGWHSLRRKGWRGDARGLACGVGARGGGRRSWWRCTGSGSKGGLHGEGVARLQELGLAELMVATHGSGSIGPRAL